MSIIARIGQLMYRLDRRELYQYILGAFGLGALLFFIGAYRHHRTVAALRSRLRQVNSARDESRRLLEKYARVQAQRATVETLIAQEPYFKIADYITTTLKELQLSGKLSGNPEVSEHDVGSDYVEITLTMHLHEVNLKQIVDLLTKIRQNQRVYAREVKMSKSKTAKELDATVVVATFETKKSLA